MDERDYIAMNKELKTKSMKSKTAVEWLVEQIREYGIVNEACIEQANKMFENQIVKSYYDGQLSVLHIVEESLTLPVFDLTSDKEDKEDAIAYYNETFKTKL
jgi:hypothetical protein